MTRHPYINTINETKISSDSEGEGLVMKRYRLHDYISAFAN